MKKLLLLVLALLPLLASCGGDDDDNNNGGGSSSTSIEGVWFEKSEYTYNLDYATDKPDYTYEITRVGLFAMPSEWHTLPVLCSFIKIFI